MAILLMAVANSYATFGQKSSAVDSLENLIDTNSGIEKYPPMISLVRNLAETNYEKALEVARQAHDLAIDNADSAKIVESRQALQT